MKRIINVQGSLCEKQKSIQLFGCPDNKLCGEEGIRTPVTIARKHAFQACALSHSAISPKRVRKCTKTMLNLPVRQAGFKWKSVLELADVPVEMTKF